MAKSSKAIDFSPTLVATHITINTIAVMDVPAILNEVVGPLSMDPGHPTPISHKFIYMSSDDQRGWSTPNGDTANITLNANVGDTISFYGTSMDGNSSNAAFIYAAAGGPPVLNASTVNVTALDGAAQPTSPNGYPFINRTASFSSCDVKVAKKGTAQNFWLYAALFTTDDTGENQVLMGYVGWDPTVIVK